MPASEVARWSVMIAQRAGAKTIRPSALAAVQAACRYLCRPTPVQATAACGCPIRTCEQWIDKIEACVLAETSAEAAAVTRQSKAVQAARQGRPLRHAHPMRYTPSAAWSRSVTSITEQDHPTAPRR